MELAYRDLCGNYAGVYVDRVHRTLKLYAKYKECFDKSFIVHLGLLMERLILQMTESRKRGQSSWD